MKSGVGRFYSAIENPEGRTAKELVGLFVYYLTVELQESAASKATVDGCFKASELTPPKRTAAILAEGVGEGFYVKVAEGRYKLQRHYREELSKMLGAERIVVQANAELRILETKLGVGAAKDFLKETIDCYEAGANRATIIMCWILAMDHLMTYVLKHHLAVFNVELAKNLDKRVKISTITARDDFSEIPEGKFIELLRSAGVISKDVRKILDEKLGTRNTSAHPSGVTIKPSKVVDFVDDLVSNVVLKYSI